MKFKNIKGIENYLKKVEKSGAKADCYAAAQPFIRLARTITGYIRTAKNLEDEYKTAVKALHERTEAQESNIAKYKANMEALKNVLGKLKTELKDAQENEDTEARELKIATFKANIKKTNEALKSSNETLKTVKAAAKVEIDMLKDSVNTKKAKVKEFIESLDVEEI